MMRTAIGSDERSELTDALEGPDRPAGAAHLRGIGAGILETIAPLGVGGGQRGDPLQDRMDVSLQHRGWRPVASACSRARSRGLRRPDPLRHS
jgi:hypothetical protein